MNNENSVIHNPHLEGGPFVWEGNRLGVLLMHGFTATTAEVRLLAERLHREQNYTVSAPLLAGHYTTPDALNETTWQDWLDGVDFTYQMLATKCQKVFVGGESTGAVLALNLASKYPEIAGVLAYAPAIRLQMSFLQRLKLRAAAPFVPYLPKENIDANENWQGYRVNPLKAAVQLLELQRATLKRLTLIKQPVLIVQGRRDITIHPRSGEIILSKISSATKQLHWMEKSTHVVLLDQELEQVTAITQQFIHDTLHNTSEG